MEIFAFLCAFNHAFPSFDYKRHQKVPFLFLFIEEIIPYSVIFLPKANIFCYFIVQYIHKENVCVSPLCIAFSPKFKDDNQWPKFHCKKIRLKFSSLKVFTLLL
ncbi:hypothetical protein VIBNIAM115_2050002 [Vibrio nigripulchritudo AM115]|nr:hypothetical protein VIBNIAM115_2050002 [Vibrio nigripulchritudo AM115]